MKRRNKQPKREQQFNRNGIRMDNDRPPRKVQARRAKMEDIRSYENEKLFTQEEVNEIIKSRLARFKRQTRRLIEEIEKEAEECEESSELKRTKR